MATDALSDRELARLLDQQIAALAEVHAALVAERTALDGRDAGALEAAVAAKTQFLNAAGELEARRQSVVRSLGFAGLPGAPGASWRSDSHLAQRWQQLILLARQCQELNDRNGLMISAQRRRVEGTLRLLRGTDPATEGYGSAGLPRAITGQRSLASI